MRLQTVVSRRPFGIGRKNDPGWAASLREIRACSLFILDKGKPVARPGRKTKGRSVQAER